MIRIHTAVYLGCVSTLLPACVATKGTPLTPKAVKSCLKKEKRGSIILGSVDSLRTASACCKNMYLALELSSESGMQCKTTSY